MTESGSRNNSKSIENILNKIIVENFPNVREEIIFQPQVIDPQSTVHHGQGARPQPDMIKETPVHSVPWSRGQTSVRHDQGNTCPQCTMLKILKEQNREHMDSIQKEKENYLEEEEREQRESRKREEEGRQSSKI